MDDDIAEVEQSPTGIAVDLSGKRTELINLPHLPFDKTGQRPQLRFAVRSGDDEEVGDTGIAGRAFQTE